MGAAGVQAVLGGGGGRMVAGTGRRFVTREHTVG